MRSDAIVHRRRGRRLGRRRRRAGQAKLAEVCPVDIFAALRRLTSPSVEANLDECVLCRLCLDAAPAGTVKVIKKYDDDSVLTTVSSDRLA